MCLAIPSKVEKIENDMAVVDVDGAKRNVSLLLLSDVNIGDYVIVHAGFALEILNEEDAKETLGMIREMVSPV